MSLPPRSPAELSVLEELRGLSDRYALGADRRDGEMFAAAFLPDGVLYVHRADPDGPADGRRQGEQQLAEVAQLLGRYDVTFHVIGNRVIDLAEDGESATGAVYCLAHHINRSKGTDYVMHIRYDDVYALDRHRAWRIAERHCRVLFTETRAIDQPA